MRRGVVVVGVLLLAVVGGVMLATRSGPCDVIADRDFIDDVSDHSPDLARPTMQEAVADAFAFAGSPTDVQADDLDPIVQSDGTLVYVGAHEHFLILAPIGGGWVAVSAPRPCSTL